jgi:hypothetical protein
MMKQLQHLTYLKLDGGFTAGPDEASPAPQPLQAVTGLVDLRLACLSEGITSSMLSGMQRLTRLELSGEMAIEPGALAGKTQLQYLRVDGCGIVGGAAGVSQLLSHLQPMQQLTHLKMGNCLLAVEGSNSPASAYAALTASSKLQHLDVCHCTLPAGVWQHVLPTGRQLPNLQSLSIRGAKQPGSYVDLTPEGSRLVSCCPSLQSLQIGFLRCSAELLTPLQRLSGLQTLKCTCNHATAGGLQAVCQLTGLRELDVWSTAHIKEDGLLLQLTQLKQLTCLHHLLLGSGAEIELSGEVDPLKRLVLSLLFYHVWVLELLNSARGSSCLAMTWHILDSCPAWQAPEARSQTQHPVCRVTAVKPGLMPPSVLHTGCVAR